MDQHVDMSGRVAGVDGCAGGWVVCIRDLASGALEAHMVGSFREIVEDARLAVIGVDMPIGLPAHYERGGRTCDRSARQRLGARRGASVFPCPARPVLDAGSYDEALRLNRDVTGEPVGLSKQCYNLLPKIRDVDRCLSSLVQERVYEVHPELAFYELNASRPILASKKTTEGQAQRVALLETAWKKELSETIEATRGKGCARDDIVDAMVVCWTAERILRGEAIFEPAASNGVEEPERDPRGLRMEIAR